MNKVTHFRGQPVFGQILSWLDRAKIRSISREYDKYVKVLDGWTNLCFYLLAVMLGLDSLRELPLVMLGEVRKLRHLGLNYMVRRSTFSDANNKRPSKFYERVYKSTYDRYKAFLDESSGEAWEKALYVMDSTTISLFSTIFKGAGRNPKHGKKKGGIKAHTVMKYSDEVLRAGAQRDKLHLCCHA